MQRATRFTMAMLTALALCLPAMALAETPVLHTVQGTYLRSETGDYHHVVFLVQGEELSLFCHPWFADTLDALQPEGQVIVTYAEEFMHIPGAGDSIAIEALKYVNIPDPGTQGLSFQMGFVQDQD